MAIELESKGTQHSSGNWRDLRGWPRKNLALCGLVLFVVGWSTMWASALQLIPFVPVSACPLLMLLGLLTLRRSIRLYLPATGPVAEKGPSCAARKHLVCPARPRPLRKIRRYALVLYLISNGRRATPSFLLNRRSPVVSALVISLRC